VRTSLGNSIDWGFAPSDPVTNGALKRVYGQLGEDLNSHAAAVSPEAKAAVSDASALYKANQAKRDILNTVINKAGGPEAVYQAATNGTKLGATKIGAVMSSLDPENANVVRATVLNKLGQTRPGAADAENSFNAATFLTNWNKLAPEAKDALFGASGPAGSLRGSLDSLTQTIGTLREAGHTLENPSGTAGSLGHTFTLWEALKKGAEGVGFGGAVGAGVHHFGLSAVTGAASGVAALGGAAVLNNVMARALTNPRTAAWLAQTTKLPTSALPNAVNQLSKMNDPDAQHLAATMQSGQ
jgi:hypothetical protein